MDFAPRTRRSGGGFLSVACGLLLLLATACEDPSNVGIGLVGDQGGTPSVVAVAADEIATDTLVDVTGNTERVLAARVVDPLLGTLTAAGYFDFQTPAGIDDEFRSGPVTAVELRLARNYVYGDTTSTVALRLRAMPAAWDAEGAEADTTLEAGAPIHEFSFPATDTLVVVPFPEAWIEANSATLRAEDFNTAFHGFQLEAVSDAAVVGFDRAGTEFRVVSGGDTVDFPVSRTLTTLERAGPLDVPEGYLPLQDGIGPTVRLRFDFEAREELLQKALNRVDFRLHADTTLLETNAPPGFYRPPLRTVALIAVSNAGLFLDLNLEVTLDENGRFNFNSPTLTGLVQRMLLQDSVVDHFQLVVPTALPSINALLFHSEAMPEKAPEAVLTISPITP